MAMNITFPSDEVKNLKNNFLQFLGTYFVIKKT